MSWIALAAFTLVSAPDAWAGPPVGAFSISFEEANSVFGGAEIPEQCDELGCYSLSLAAAPDGSLSGDFLFEIDTLVDGVPLTGTVPGEIEGRVSGAKGRARFNPKGRGGGVLDYGGTQLGVIVKFRLNARVDGAARLGTSRGKVQVCDSSGRRCQGEKVPAETVPLAPEDGGPWELALELDMLDERTVTGTALATFSDGSEPVSFDVSGTYDAKRDRAKLLLLSTAPGSGSKIRLYKLVVADGALAGYTAKYKVKGQKGNLKLVAP